ncbi:dihydrofolate reductase [Aquimarina sp. U1-2]|uniref:dihydrofolate reductase family protein n=1 Tax=Aquimarina sp. U1-2 TaxID=2823141 RepID=UPI001AECD89F|nr:dihydrofolate reductase family protein [Aquimarina sp. U1-2]MBP2833038.1 dihydrofolate reductase [Aquimarina sp. U1-2]
MDKANKVFIATSLDGFIADKNGGLDWLYSVPNPNNEDNGYVEFMSSVDALVMGRNTFETILGFDIDWPYEKPVFVLSRSLKTIPESHREKAFLVNGPLTEVLKQIHERGHYGLYIDGGSTIQSFLKEDLIDEIIISRIPVILGRGFPLFDELPNKLEFELTQTKVFLNQITQSRYIRKK